MYSHKCILKMCTFNPSLHHRAVLNIWTPTRNITFLQKCKDCINMVVRNKSKKEALCKSGESSCTVPEDWSPRVESQNSQSSASVIIVGAGMSGLSAANHLQNNGINNITILEASDRPGGRIQSSWFGDTVIELGSELDGDAALNPILSAAVEDGFTSHPLNKADPGRGLLRRSDGSSIPYPLSFHVYQKFKQVWDQAVHIEQQESGGKHNILRFVGSRVEQELRTISPEFQADAKRVFSGLVNLATIKSNNDSSLITSDSFGDFIQLPGSKIKVPLGYFGEPNLLYESLNRDRVEFGKTVTRISWGGVLDVYPRAVVLCDDGSSYPADYVIITIPLGSMKALAYSLFCPGLPASKLDAVLKIPVGFANKIFLEFAQPFWMWKDMKKITFTADSMKCYEGWVRGVCSVEPVPGSYHVVCVTVAGPQAQCMEHLPDRDVICHILPLLKKTYGMTNIAHPLKIKRTAWCNDEKFYGSYSFKGPGVILKDFYRLASPLPEPEYCDPVLLFAGEATCPVNFGTVKGARASGIREADRLLQLLRQREESSDSEPCRVAQYA